jgi:tetratricopeptide (TPR) repeat protein
MPLEPPPEDRFEALLLAYEEARAAGASPEEALAITRGQYQSWADAQDELRAFLDRLERAWPPRSGRSAPPPTGELDLPGYEILGEVGRGGMGVVYKARQVSLDRVVAFKVIRDGGQARPDERRRFRAEAEAAARLQHPNIVQIYEVAEHAGRPCLVMEFVDGPRLEQRPAGVPVPAHAAAILVETLARAMQHAHERGVVHRDLKPANILLSFSRDAAAEGVGGSRSAAASRLNEAFPKITDFGLARRLDTPRVTCTGAIVGTPDYMAPEQADPQPGRDAGPAADVYALGAILYDLLTGRPPHRGGTALETLEQVRGREPVPPARLNPAVPRDLETVCLKCLRKESGRRYASAQDLADDLARFQRGQAIRARPVGAAERAWGWCRRQPWVAGLAAGLLLALVSGLSASLHLWRRAEASADLARTNERHARAQRERAVRHLSEVDAARRQAERHARQTRRLLVKCFQASRSPSMLRPASQPVRRDLLVEIAARYRQLLAEQPGDRALRAELADVTTSLGSLHLKTWHFRRARHAFQAALELWQGLLREDRRNRDCRAGLARTHEWFGAVHEAEVCLPARLAELTAAYRLWRGLARERPTPALLLSRATCAAEVGRCSALVAPDRALHRLEEARDTLTGLLAADPDNRAARQVLGATYTTLGQLHDRRAPAKALRCYRSAYGQFKRLLREAPEDFTAMSKLAECCLWLSGGKTADPYTAEAVALYEQALARLEGQFGTDPENTDVNLLVRCNCTLGICYQQGGDLRRALRAFRRCAALGRDLATRHPQVATFGHYWAEGLGAVAVLELEAGRPADAPATTREAVAAFAVRFRNPAFHAPAHSELGSQFRATAALLRRRGAAAEALALADQVKGIYDQLYRGAPGQGLYGLMVSESWAQIAKSQWRLGRHEETLVALRQARDTQRALCERFPTVEQYRLALADRWFRLGRFFGERGRRADAERCFLQVPPLCPRDAVKLSLVARELRQLAASVAEGYTAVSRAEQAEKRRYLAAADRVARRAAAALSQRAPRTVEQVKANAGKR